jgi:hypothetical protein
MRLDLDELAEVVEVDVEEPPFLEVPVHLPQTLIECGAHEVGTNTCMCAKVPEGVGHSNGGIQAVPHMVAHASSGGGKVAEKQAFLNSNLGPDVLHVVQGQIKGFAQDGLMLLPPRSQHDVVGQNARGGASALDQSNPGTKIVTDESHREGAPLWNTTRVPVLFAQPTSNGVPIGQVVVEPHVSSEESRRAPTMSKKKHNEKTRDLIKALENVSDGPTEVLLGELDFLKVQAEGVPSILSTSAPNASKGLSRRPALDPRLKLAKPQTGVAPVEVGQDGQDPEVQWVLAVGRLGEAGTFATHGSFGPGRPKLDGL